VITKLLLLFLAIYKVCLLLLSIKRQR